MEGELLLTAKDITTVNQWATGWARNTRGNGAQRRLQRYDDFMRETADVFRTSAGAYRFDIIPVLLFDCHGMDVSVNEWEHLRNSLMVRRSARPVSGRQRDGDGDVFMPAKRRAADPDSRSHTLFRARSFSSTAVSTASVSAASTDTDTSGRSDESHVGAGEQELRRQVEALKLENKALKFLLDTKDQKISQQKKIIKHCQTKSSRASKQLERFKNVVAVGLKRECEGKKFEITRVQTCKMKEKKLSQLQYGRLEAYLESEEGAAGIEDEEPMAGGWLTPQGTIALALRRNLTNCAAQDLGLVLLQDTSKSTVLRSECKVGAALVADSRIFFERWQHDVYHGPHLSEDYPSVTLTFLHYREDATNHRHKMMAMELHAAYVVSSQDADALSAIGMEHMSSMKRLADVVPVSDGSGLGTMKMSEKMLSSLGCPTWRHFLEVHESHVQAEESQPVLRSLV